MLYCSAGLKKKQGFRHCNFDQPPNHAVFVSKLVFYSPSGRRVNLTQNGEVARASTLLGSGSFNRARLWFLLLSWKGIGEVACASIFHSSGSFNRAEFFLLLSWKVSLKLYVLFLSSVDHNF